MTFAAFQTAFPLLPHPFRPHPAPPSTNSSRPKRPFIHRLHASAEEENQTTPPFEQLFLKGPVPGDRLVRTISATGEVSCRVITCTGLVHGAARLHHTSPVVTTAFGRALTCALLLSSGKKDSETLQVEFRGNGPIKGITAIANGSGEVRGYMGNPSVHIPIRGANLDVSTAIGKGVLAVVRSSNFSKQPYTGLTQISSGEVAEDLARYLSESEQTPSALGAGVYLDAGGMVTAAGGYLMQLLPGASERTAEIVERNVRAIGKPTEFIREGRSLEDIVNSLMNGLEPMKVASTSPRYACQCGMDRVKRTVALIPEMEVRQLLKDQGKIEARCEFCGQVYALLPEEVEKIFDARK